MQPSTLALCQTSVDEGLPGGTKVAGPKQTHLNMRSAMIVITALRHDPVSVTIP